MTETEKIEQLSGIRESECACDHCKNMCHRQVCIGTPADILRLINAGHIDKLKNTLWSRA